MLGATLIPTVLAKVSMITIPQNIVVGIEVVPLSIHVVHLFFKVWLYRALSTGVITLAKITSHNLCRRCIWSYPYILLNSRILNSKGLDQCKNSFSSINLQDSLLLIPFIGLVVVVAGY